MRLIITSGHDKSYAAIALCELLTRSGHNIEAVFVVTPFNIKRLRALIRQRGLAGIKKLVKKLFPIGKKNSYNNFFDKFLREYDISHRSLKKWCKWNNSKCFIVNNLNSKDSISKLKQINPDAVIYSGGGILSSSFIKAAKERIINNHSGPLPEIRGMNAIEWSILLEYETSITIHLIDKGIDTGKIISKKKISIDKESSLDLIRDKAVISGVEEIVRLFEDLEDFNNLRTIPNLVKPRDRQCFIMTPAIKELLLKKLKSRDNV